MKKIIKYTLAGFSLFFLAINAAGESDDKPEVLAQYKEGGGVATSKKVGTQNQDGTYTITLETFATGTTTSIETSVPADVVLVLDLSTSMCASRGTRTRVNNTGLSYDMVVNARSVSDNYLYYYSSTYRQIFAEKDGNNYYLYVNRDGSNERRYLTVNNQGIVNGTTSSKSSAAKATTSNGIIASSNNSNSSNTSVFFSGSSRIFALKEAVCAFINTINQKDIENGQNGVRLGNKISILTFESDVTVHQQLEFIENISLDGLKQKVWDFSLRTGTQPSEGIDEANSQLTARGHTGTIGKDFTRTLVVFTDGDPYDSPKYVAVNNARTSKNSLGATVYTVGMFDSSPSTGSDRWNFLNFMSSNYPNAYQEGNSDNGNTMHSGDGGSDKGFYKDASKAEVDLTAIFTEIANASGGSEKTIGASTQVRDVVSSSFAISFPDGVTTAEQKQAWVNTNVSVYTSAIAADGKSWGTETTYSAATIQYKEETDADGVKYDAIWVEGFDYSLADQVDENNYTVTAGNWVGLRYSDANTPFYAGKKLVIRFNVRIEGDVTGGITGTNTKASGVYVYDEETKEYHSVNTYEVPSKVLSVTIKISKKGLRSGESATFLINKTTPLKDENGNIVYNAIGKPEPDPENWDTDHKIILTNKSTVNGQEVIKTLMGLDPGYVYEVVEDDWSWAYTMTGSGQSMTTSSVTINPFRFQNTEKTTISGQPVRKHAEAVSINHFGRYVVVNGVQTQTENYKSSKTTFSSENTNANNGGQ